MNKEFQKTSSFQINLMNFKIIFESNELEKSSKKEIDLSELIERISSNYDGIKLVELLEEFENLKMFLDLPERRENFSKIKQQFIKGYDYLFLIDKNIAASINLVDFDVDSLKVNGVITTLDFSNIEKRLKFSEMLIYKRDELIKKLFSEMSDFENSFLIRIKFKEKKNLTDKPNPFNLLAIFLFSSFLFWKYNIESFLSSDFELFLVYDKKIESGLKLKSLFLKYLENFYDEYNNKNNSSINIWISDFYFIKIFENNIADFKIHFLLLFISEFENIKLDNLNTHYIWTRNQKNLLMSLFEIKKSLINLDCSFNKREYLQRDFMEIRNELTNRELFIISSYKILPKRFLEKYITNSKNLIKKNDLSNCYLTLPLNFLKDLDRAIVKEMKDSYFKVDFSFNFKKSYENLKYTISNLDFEISDLNLIYEINELNNIDYKYIEFLKPKIVFLSSDFLKKCEYKTPFEIHKDKIISFCKSRKILFFLEKK